MVVCYCNQVTEKDIRDAIYVKGAKTVDEVIRLTGAMENSNCAVNNPKGVCCYGDIAKTFNRFMETTDDGEPDNACSCSDCGKGEAKKIAVDFLYLDLNTCERCKATDATLDDALSLLTPVFQTLHYDVTVNKVNIKTEALAKQYHFISSPTIRVNGVDISSELLESDCKDCGDMCGDEVDCRVFVYDGESYEQPPPAMIVDGMLRVLYGQKRESKLGYVLPDNLKKFFDGRKLTMKTMKIYEPAMCCPTGLCGVSVDPELLRISTVLNTLEKKGAPVERFNLTSAPMEFVTTKVISEHLMKDAESLPITTLDGEIVMTGRYPSNDEFVTMLDLPAGTLSGDLEAPDAVKEEPEEAQGGCCCEGGCC